MIRPWRVPLIVGSLALGLLFAGWLPAQGQEPSGLDAAAALEGVLVEAIAASERSVVAIARSRRSDNDRIDTLTDSFGRFRPPSTDAEGGRSRAARCARLSEARCCLWEGLQSRCPFDSDFVEVP